jgi:hypothetical protein
LWSWIRYTVEYLLAALNVNANGDTTVLGSIAAFSHNVKLRHSNVTAFDTNKRQITYKKKRLKGRVELL